MTQPPEWNTPPQPPPPPPAPAGAAVPTSGGAYSSGSPYAAPGAPQPPAERSGLSITAFILGLLGCVPLVSVLAVVVGIVALVKKQSLRGLAIAGVALGVMWTLGFVAFLVAGGPALIAESIEEAVETTTGEPGNVAGTGTDSDPGAQTGTGSDSDGDSGADIIASFDLGLGDCFNDAIASAAGTDETFESGDIERVDCAQPHAYEVYHISDMADGDFPGAEAVQDAVDTTCLDSFEEFIGLPYQDSIVEVIYYFPTESSWRFGEDRTIICAATEGESSTGSLRGANR